MIDLIARLARPSARLCPTPGEEAEALKFPGGYIYRIAGGLDPSASVPFDAVVGWWKVDEHGRIARPFQVNRRYNPEKWSRRRA